MVDLGEYWPTWSHGSIILTTRNQNFIHPPVSTSLPLKCFTAEEGAKFILRTIHPESLNTPHESASDAAQVSIACGGLPLALAQVVRLASSLNLGVADVRERFPTAESFIRLDSELNEIGSADYYHQSKVSLLWDKSLQSLDPSSYALAQVLAYLDPDGIHEDILTSDANQPLQSQLGTTAG